MKKRIKPFIILLTLLIPYFTIGSTAAENTYKKIPEEAVAAAEERLHELKYAFLTAPENWGADKNAKEEDITLGKACHVSYLALGITESNSIYEIIDKTESENWFFTVDVNNIAQRCIIVGRNDNGSYYPYDGIYNDTVGFENAKQVAEELANQKDLTLFDDIIIMDGKYYFLLTGDTEFLVPAYHLQPYELPDEEKQDITLSDNSQKIQSKEIKHYVITSEAFFKAIQELYSYTTGDEIYYGHPDFQMTETNIRNTDDSVSSHIYLIPPAIMLLSGIALYCLNRKKNAVIYSDGQTSD